MTPVLRLAALMAAALAAGPAWADSPPLDVASLVRDGGPWGMVTVLCSVIWFLWSKLGSRDTMIADLQDKRAEEARATTKEVVASSITSTTAIADTNKRLADHDTRIQGLTDKLSTLPADIARILANQEKIFEKLPRPPGVQGGP